MLFYRFIPLLAFIFQLFLFFVVARVKGKQAVHWVFLVFLGSMSLWGFVIFGLRNSPSLDSAFHWEQVLLPTLVVDSYSFFFFSIFFPRRSLSKAKFFSLIGFSALLIIISPTTLVLKGMQLRPYGYAPIIG